MSRKSFKQPAEKAPEEVGAHKSVGRKGGANLYDGGGFSEGSYGRGPMPYKASHSVAPGSLEQHAGSAGRGGTGRIGKGDGFKTRSQDVEPPVDHAAFEKLGRE